MLLLRLRMCVFLCHPVKYHPPSMLSTARVQAATPSPGQAPIRDRLRRFRSHEKRK